ncbi:MAG TPA: class I SAM-dependent methyltransferase [Acetobacteraceae bacterium]|jgi:2-polyprenyl-3-methyl-5-hydroxy-6-metoxy-1,4-benzoquinol methylase|nr:class I SAM-dependent methyltransferase [Acetobacteraceae bacterium]
METSMAFGSSNPGGSPVAALDVRPPADMNAGRDDGRCRLCAGAVVRKAGIDAGALSRAYKRIYGIDVTHLMHDVREIDFHECPNCGLLSFSPPIAGDSKFYAALSAWFDSRFHSGGKRGEAIPPRSRRAGLPQIPPALLQQPDPRSRQEFELASAYIESGMSVLEVGCGKCFFWNSLPANIRADSRYVGLELDLSAVAAGKARQIDVRAEFIEQHASTAMSQYDVVCFFQVLEHIVDIRVFLDACVRCLKPGGRLIFSVPNARSFLGHQPDNVLNMPPHHVTWWTEMPIRNLAAELQLQVETIAEDDLTPFYDRDFMKVLAMNYLRRLFKVQQQFELEGYSYLVRRYISALASRLLASCATGIGSTARGHSITAVLRLAS